MKDKIFGTSGPWQVKFMRCMAVFTLMVSLSAALIVADADAQSPLRVRCEWRAGTQGSTPVLYQLQIHDLDDGVDFTYVVPAQPGPVQEFYFVDGSYLRRYVARVRGVDADGDEGPWSQWSPVAVFEVADPPPPTD